MMRKFWNAAIWSNFSAQSPAIRPSVPSMRRAEQREDDDPQRRWRTCSGANQTVTTQHAGADRPAPRTTEAPT